MRPEELKKLEYGFSDGVFILFVNGTEEWRRTRSELAENRTILGTVHIHVGNGEFAFVIYPRFKSQSVKIIGPLELKDKLWSMIEDKMDWFIGIEKIELFGTIKEQELLDKMVGEYKRKVIEYKSKIKEYEKLIKEFENIIKLLEKVRSDKKWK